VRGEVDLGLEAHEFDFNQIEPRGRPGEGRKLLRPVVELGPLGLEDGAEVVKEADALVSGGLHREELQEGGEPSPNGLLLVECVPQLESDLQDTPQRVALHHRRTSLVIAPNRELIDD